jgi:uncharacterized membrane protein YecN with MAPEG domain
MPTITMLYAGLLGLLAFWLAFLAGRLRGKTGISIGDGDNVELRLAMRRHANFVEFVPLTLILIGLLEMSGIPGTAVHAMAGGLVVFRICHAVGLEAETTQSALRGIGAGGGSLVLVVASIWSIVAYF